MTPSYIKVTLSSWGTRILIALLQIVNIRIILEIVPKDSYALIILLQGVMGWFALSDLGMGLALQNLISESRAKKQEYKNVISVVTLVVMLISILFIGGIYLSSNYIVPHFFKSITSLTESTKLSVFFTTAFLFITINSSSIIFKIWYAEHKGYLASLVTLISAVITTACLAILLFFSHEEEPNSIKNISLSLFGPLLICTFIPLLLRVRSHKLDLSILRNKIKVKKFRNNSLGILVFGFFGLVVAHSDYLVLSQTILESDEIIKYGIVSKVFTIMFSFYASFSAAFLPVSSEMVVLAQREALLKKAVIISTLSVVFFLCFGIFFWILQAEILRIISPKIDVKIELITVFLFVSYFCIRVWTDTWSILMFSGNKFKILIGSVILHACISLCLQYVLSIEYGINGILAGLIIAYLVTGVWFSPYYCYKYLIPR